jgi:glycine dehydrogenase
MTQSLTPSDFLQRHLGPSLQEQQQMLSTLRVNSLEELVDQTVPSSIRLDHTLNLPSPLHEHEMLKHLRDLASKNKVYKTYIGQGYYNTFTPAVILRNIFENPGWYTQYTPYQAEISQGRLEALMNFQTLVSDLTGLPFANASLLDEGTAAAEAMTLLHRNRPDSKKDASTFFVSQTCFPQTIEVLKTRAYSLGFTIVVGDWKTLSPSADIFGVLFQYPDHYGAVCDYRDCITRLQAADIRVAVASDLLALTLLESPGTLGADVCIGSSQRFGVPMGFGGPHAAFIAVKDEFKRSLPGRIIGLSVDQAGQPAYRMALQTREQHIRREKATSNICTAQALLAIMAGMFAVYHGPEGLKAIATRVHGLAVSLAEALKVLGVTLVTETFFDTVSVNIQPTVVSALRVASELKGINFGYDGDAGVRIALDETTTLEDVKAIVALFAQGLNKPVPPLSKPFSHPQFKVLSRKTPFCTHPVFNTHRSESQMLRYIKQLENKDLSLTSSMIPLGSCTMKLNATTQMIPLSWPEFSSIHPFAPANQVEGYLEAMASLEAYLAEITGFSGCSLQPNSGAQGEYAGLLAIKRYFEAKDQSHRTVILIPSSAHGTNPATAALSGFEIAIVRCDDNGNIDINDLREKAEKVKDTLAGLMVTYPSTHGVFEESIQEVCGIIHQYGGQVYMDGANMNAQVGLTSPANIGADVCHLNLHKTFAIPHGGGGPGMGPICVASHLVPFLPGKHEFLVSSAPYGSASILLISYAYIRLLGAVGVTEATRVALLNANYLKVMLEPHFSVLYQGKNGRVAHELILDFRAYKKEAKIEVEDVAKRLMDYGFHAPTMSFPVPGTLMIEPTESEDKAELDRFCEALIAIKTEIVEVASGKADPADNVLKQAPHTAFEATSDLWNHGYSREKAVFPLPYVKQSKFWPSVKRIDNAYGDRNLVCTCAPIEDYQHV